MILPLVVLGIVRGRKSTMWVKVRECSWWMVFRRAWTICRQVGSKDYMYLYIYLYTYVEVSMVEYVHVGMFVQLFTSVLLVMLGFE